MFRCLNYDSEMCEVAFKAGDKLNVPAILIEKEFGIPMRHTQYDLAEAEVEGIVLKAKKGKISVLLDVRVWITREGMDFTEDGSRLVPQAYFFMSSEENIQEYKQRISRINFAGGLNEKVQQKIELLLKNMQTASLYKLTYPKRICMSDDTYNTDLASNQTKAEFKIPKGTEIEMAYMHKVLEGERKDMWYGCFASQSISEDEEKEESADKNIYTIVPVELEKNQSWID